MEIRSTVLERTQPGPRTDGCLGVRPASHPSQALSVARRPYRNAVMSGRRSAEVFFRAGMVYTTKQSDGKAKSSTRKFFPSADRQLRRDIFSLCEHVFCVLQQLQMDLQCRIAIVRREREDSRPRGSAVRLQGCSGPSKLSAAFWPVPSSELHPKFLLPVCLGPRCTLSTNSQKFVLPIHLGSQITPAPSRRGSI